MGFSNQSSSSPDGAYNFYEAFLSQSGTSNPSETIFYSSFGGITWVRDGVGTYTATGFSGGLSPSAFLLVSDGGSTVAKTLQAVFVDGDTIKVSAYSLGVLTDNVKFYLQVKMKIAP